MAGSVTGQETDAVRAEGLRHRGQRARSCAGAWLALAVLSAFGCEAITGLPDAKAPRAPGAPPDCSDVALVEDFEDNDDQIVLEAGRDGFVYTYLDELGSTVEPSDKAFAAASGGSEKSGFAGRFHGKTAKGEESFAGLGLNFTENERPYDASAYRGFSFWARAAEGTTPYVRVQLADANTDPVGGVCTDCFNDFGVTIPLTSEWQRFAIPFSDLKQETGWGNPRPPALDASKLVGMKWQVGSPNAEYDVWIDKVELVSCP